MPSPYEIRWNDIEHYNEYYDPADNAWHFLGWLPWTPLTALINNLKNAKARGARASIIKRDEELLREYEKAHQGIQGH